MFTENEESSHQSEKKQTVLLQDRKRLVLDGVRGVVEFTDGVLTFLTDFGKMSAEGTDLRMETLDRESGKMVAVGHFQSIYYHGSGEDGNRREKRFSLFGKKE